MLLCCIKVENYKENGLDGGVVLKMLSAINRGSERRQLESAARISCKQLSQYLEELIKDCLVSYDVSDGATLKITEKGSRFLISYERVAASQAGHESPRGAPRPQVTLSFMLADVCVHVTARYGQRICLIAHGKERVVISALCPLPASSRRA